MTLGRRWTLARHPLGSVREDDFALVSDPWAEPDLPDGAVLLRNRLFSVAPTIRNWLGDKGASYRGALPLGGTIPGMVAGEVLASRHPRFAAGQRVVAMAGWEDRSVIQTDRAQVPVFPVPDGMMLEDALGPLSPNSLTAYFGMTEVGRVRAGDAVLVSGAAGSVGAVACQVARIAGARVVGTAGGEAKCAWLREACGVADVIDYRAEDVAARLAALFPRGIDLFFDNVGGAILDMAIDRMAPRGRVALCGQISAYDGDGRAPGPSDMMKVVYGRLRIEGFVVGDFAAQADAAHRQLAAWIDAGALVVRTDLRRGFAELPRAFVDLFAGRNAGTLIVSAH